MGFKDNLVKKRDGSFVLKHKTKKHKKGDCPECGENPKDRELGLLYRYKQDDLLLILFSYFCITSFSSIIIILYVFLDNI